MPLYKNKEIYRLFQKDYEDAFKKDLNKLVIFCIFLITHPEFKSLLPHAEVIENDFHDQDQPYSSLTNSYANIIQCTSFKGNISTFKIHAETDEMAYLQFIYTIAMFVKDKIEHQQHHKRFNEENDHIENFKASIDKLHQTVRHVSCIHRIEKDISSEREHIKNMAVGAILIAAASAFILVSTPLSIVSVGIGILSALTIGFCLKTIIDSTKGIKKAKDKLKDELNDFHSKQSKNLQQTQTIKQTSGKQKQGLPKLTQTLLILSQQNNFYPLKPKEPKEVSSKKRKDTQSMGFSALGK